MAQVTFSQNDHHNGPSMLELKPAIGIKATFSENNVGEPEFFQYSHSESELDHMEDSSLHSIFRDSISTQQQDVDTISTVTGITDIFNSDDEDKIVIPILPPKDHQEFTECLDSSPLLTKSATSESTNRQINGPMHNIKLTALLEGCSQKVILLEDILAKSTQSMRLVNDTLPKLEQMLRAKHLRERGETECPYKKMLNEFGRNGEYTHEAFVLMKKKTWLPVVLFRCCV